MTISVRKLQSLAAVAVLTVGLGVSSAAGAQVSSASGSGIVTPPEVLGVAVEAPTAVADTQALAEAVTVGGLAMTGTDIAATAALGISAVALGAGLLVASRRREAQT